MCPKISGLPSEPGQRGPVHPAPCNRWGWPESLAFVLYLVVVCLGLRWHEPWADEAQAWLLARDMGWLELLRHGVRYEGSPALWHSLLWVLVRLHVSYGGMHWIGAAIEACGMAVLLRYAPFPRLLRLLLPFTFFLAYQQAVVARSYELLAVLLFGCMALLRRERPSVLWASLLLGLLANVSIHGFVLSLGLGAVALVLWRRAGFPATRWLRGLALLLAFWTVAVATTLPPSDIGFPAGKNIGHSWSKMTGAHTQDQADVPRLGELAPVVQPPVHHKLGGTRRRFTRLLALITFPLSTSRALGLLAFAALLATAFRLKKNRGELGALALVPYAGMLLVFQAVYLAPRHAGTLVLGFLASAWLCWPRRWVQVPAAAVLFAALVVISLQQIGWTVRAVWLDMHGLYAANPQTAELLRERGVGRPGGPRAAAFYYHSVGTLPYFDHNIYENQPAHSYWAWSTANRISAAAPSELARRPDYVVLSGWIWGDNAGVTTDWAKPEEQEGPDIPLADVYRILPLFLAHGYHETHRTCGYTWMRNGYAEELCDIVLEPAAR